MADLASCYSKLGRHQDAVLLLEESLEFQRRVLPGNHPDYDTGDVHHDFCLR